MLIRHRINAWFAIKQSTIGYETRRSKNSTSYRH